MTGIINNTKYNNFDDIVGKNSSRVYLKREKNLYKLSETKWPLLKKMEHFFKHICSGNSYWHGKERIVKHCENHHLVFGKSEPVAAPDPVEVKTPPVVKEIQKPKVVDSVPESPENPEYPGFEKYYLNYSIQLANSQFMSSLGIWNWYDKVFTLENGASIFLGALPLKPGTLRSQDGELYREFKSKGIGAILTVVEPFENHSVGYFHSAVTPQDWKENGFDQLQIPTEDYGTFSMEDLEKGVAYMEAMLKSGKSVYVHCKAGIGRSLLMVVCYLIKNRGMTVDEALAYVKATRVQSGFEQGSKKRASALAFQAKYRKGG